MNDETPTPRDWTSKATHRRKVRFAFVACMSLAAPAALTCGFPSSALAADYSMSQWVAAQLTEAREELSDKKHADALETLASARERGKLSPHEKAMVAQVEGYVYSDKRDYKRAAQKFEEALAQKAMPDQAVLELHYNLGQLYLVEKQYKQALIHMLRWVSKAKNPKGRDLFSIATTYYQADRKSGALKWARRAIATTSRPEEEWLSFATGILFERKAYKELPPLLEQLATLYPKKEYYDMLFAALVKANREKEGLGVLELSYRQGFLTKPDEVRNLAMLYIGRGVPLKGAELLEEAIKQGTLKRDFKTMELLADCYLAAKELKSAVDPLSRAGNISGNGEFFLRIGEIHVTHRDWEKARDALNQALKKGKLTDPGAAYLLLGIANFRQKRLVPAGIAFNKALQHKRSAKQARQWLNLLESRTNGES